MSPLLCSPSFSDSVIGLWSEREKGNKQKRRKKKKNCENIYLLKNKNETIFLFPDVITACYRMVARTLILLTDSFFLSPRMNTITQRMNIKWIETLANKND